MFPGFEELEIRTTGTTIRGRRGGEGPPLLLLHGIPETHLMWHGVAPALARDFTVVATDLRGFGHSDAPASTPDHAPYSMREIARDQLEVMRQLGFERFGVAGHDRGGRCAYRLALDHPDAVSRLAVLDIVPTGDAFRNADMEFSLGFWVWSFLAAPAPIPETLIRGAPDVFVNHMLDAWSDGGDLRAVPRSRDARRAARRGRPRSDADRLSRAGALEPIGCGRELVRAPRGVARMGGRRPGRGDGFRPLPAGGGARRDGAPAARVLRSRLIRDAEKPRTRRGSSCEGGAGSCSGAATGCW
jgi:pimeloyl-ACP methyl ester carboxylesterase